MTFKTSHAVFTSDDPVRNSRDAAAKLIADFDGVDIAAVVFFSGTGYDAETLAAAFKDACPGAATLGCTSAGQFTGDFLGYDSVVALAFPKGSFEFSGSVIIDDIDNDPDAVDKGVEAFHKTYGLNLRELDYREYTGFIVMDGLSPKREEIIDRLGAMTDVVFAGGCASDDQAFEQTLVMHNGQVFKNALLLALVKAPNGCRVTKTQSVEVTDTVFTATKVDEAANVILEFNGRPAAEAYAEAIGMPPDKVSLRDFIKWPLAVMVDGEPFVRSASDVTAEGGIEFFNRVWSDTRFTLTRSGDIVGDTARAVAGLREAMDGFSALIVANGVYRHAMLDREGRLDEFCAIFKDTPTIGFLSYGEIYLGMLDQSATIMAFR